MAKYPNITITQLGLNAMAKSSEKKIIYTHIALGDGVLNADDKILNFTDLKSKKIFADIGDITNDSNSQVTLQTIVSNKIVEKGFYAREIGIYARSGADGEEFLYGYANAGNNADYMPDNTQPVDELKLKITLLVGNVENVTAVINSSIIFITLEDCRREIKKHNDDITAHGDTFARKKDVYTKSETDNLLKGKANTSHGNHVPKTETANNTRFLRNDNTWQAVTPANIGAPTKTGAGASGTWGISITGNAKTATNVAWSGITGKPATYVPSSHTHDDRYYTESEINSKLSSIKLSIFPVGSIFVSLTNTNPSTFIGGTWEKVGAGRVLWGANGQTLGSTIAAGLPNIKGSFGYQDKFIVDVDDNNNNPHRWTGALYRGGKAPWRSGRGGGSGDDWYEYGFDASKSNAIYGKSTTVQPPALVVNFWKRTK